MQRSLAILLIFFVVQSAGAFDLDACMSSLQAAPYGMSEDKASVVCAAKNIQSGETDTTRTQAGYKKTRSIALEYADFVADMSAYIRSGDIKVSTCVSWCAKGEYPHCPAGYEVLPATASGVYRAGYHGRYRIRSAMCIKK